MTSNGVKFYHMTLAIGACLIFCRFVSSFRLRDLNYYDFDEDTNFADKRGGPCPLWKPFQCPEGDCIHFQFICDGNPDCPDSNYDENPRLCTAKRRPPMEYLESFLEDLLDINGDNYFVKLFGQNAKNRLEPMGGTKTVAISLSESPRLADFAKDVGMNVEETMHLGKVLRAIAENDEDQLYEMEIKPAEVMKLKMYVGKLVETGFMKPHM